MRAMVNHADNSIAFMEYGDNRIINAMLKEPSIFLVEFDEACLEGVDPDDYPNLFWDPEESIFQFGDLLALDTPSGRDLLREDVKRIALVPPDQRVGEMQDIIAQAQEFLPAGELEEMLSDDILTDDEVNEILGYLND